MTDRERAVQALAGVLDTLWDTADHLLADGTDNGWPVVSDAILQVLDANPEAKAALAAYLAPDTAPSELRAALAGLVADVKAMKFAVPLSGIPWQYREFFKALGEVNVSLDRADAALRQSETPGPECWCGSAEPQPVHWEAWGHPFSTTLPFRGQPETPGEYEPDPEYTPDEGNGPLSDAELHRRSRQPEKPE